MKKIILGIIAATLCVNYWPHTLAQHNVVLINSHHEAMNLIAQYLPANPVIINAGAYDGNDSIDMLKLWPTATIHAFEPDPQNFAKLLANSSTYSAINRYTYALSDRCGMSKFYTSELPNQPGVSSESGSLREPKDHLKYSNVVFNRVIDVETITIDAWARKYNISYIDALWLDMQGVELEVLKASPEILKTIKVIYSEALYVEAYKGQALYADIKAWLETQGFTCVAEHRQCSWFGDILMVRL